MVFIHPTLKSFFKSLKNSVRPGYTQNARSRFGWMERDEDTKTLATDLIDTAIQERSAADASEKAHEESEETSGLYREHGYPDGHLD